MSYVDRSLASDEQVLFRTRLSRIMFFWPVVLVLTGAGLLATALTLTPTPLLHGLAAAALGIALIFALARYVSFRSSEFAVTDQRVIIKLGVFRRRLLEQQRSKVEAIAVNQSIPGRLFGFGDIVVTGTGGTKEPFERIGAPMEFARAVQTARPAAAR